MSHSFNICRRHSVKHTWLMLPTCLLTCISLSVAHAADMPDSATGTLILEAGR